MNHPGIGWKNLGEDNLLARRCTLLVVFPNETFVSRLIDSRRRLDAGLKMERSFIFFVLSSVVATRTGTKLSSFHLEDAWNNELDFWGRLTCRTGSRRFFSLYESPSSDSRRLNDFFSDLITVAQRQCGATMKTTKSLLDADHRNESERKNREESLTTNPPEIIDESGELSVEKSTLQLFPFSDVEIVVSMVEDCARVLMGGNIFDNWGYRRHVLVLMIDRIEKPRQSPESLMKIVAELLQRLWRERRILHVFIATPLSSLGRRIWFYDPFFKNATSGVRGKIFARTIRGIPTVERVKDLQGYTLNIGMFDAPPAAIKNHRNSIKSFPLTRRSQKFVGIDGLTMASVASHMNFSVNIVPPTDGLEFGYVCGNGTFVGTIGDAAYHRIDIGFNSMYAKLYGQHGFTTSGIEFTVPIDFDRLCVVVPRAPKIPRWLRTYHYFHPAIWVSLMLTQILVSLVWYFLRNYDGRFRSPKRQIVSYRSVLVDTFLVFIGAPLKINPSPAEKVFLTAFLLFGVTVMGMFSGTLYHSYTTEMRYKEIANLKELDQTGIAIGTMSPNLHDVFGLDEIDDDLKEVMNLRRKFKVYPYNELQSTIERTAYQRDVASLSRENTFRVLKHGFNDETGKGLLHLVKDCPRAYYLSYVVPKDSIYIERFNVVITRIREAGLPALWNSVTANKLIAEMVAAKRKRRRPRRSSFTIHDMQTAFLLLVMGEAISFCVLMVEIVYHRRRRGSRSRSRVDGITVDIGKAPGGEILLFNKPFNTLDTARRISLISENYSNNKTTRL